MPESELLRTLLNTELARLLGVAFLIWSAGTVLSIISSIRFNNRVLVVLDNTSAAIDRNTAQQREADRRVDQVMAQDYTLRERGVVSMEASTEAMKHYTSAFKALMWAVNSSALAAAGGHQTTHDTLATIGTRLDTMTTALESLDSSTRQVVAPLEQIVHKIEVFLSEARQERAVTTARLEGVLRLLERAKDILEHAAAQGPPEPFKQSEEIHDETPGIYPTVIRPDPGAGAVRKPGAGGGVGTDNVGAHNLQSDTDGHPDFGVWSRLPGSGSAEGQTAASRPESSGRTDEAAT